MANNSTANAGLAFDARDLANSGGQLLAPVESALRNIATNASNGLYPDDQATQIDQLVEQTGVDFANVQFGVTADPNFPAYQQALEADEQQLAAYGGTTFDPHDPFNTNPPPLNNGNDPTPNTPGEDAWLNAASGANLLSKFPGAPQPLKDISSSIKNFLQMEIDGAHVIDGVLNVGKATTLGQETRPFQNQVYTDAGKLLGDTFSSAVKVPLPPGTPPVISLTVEDGLKKAFVSGVTKVTQWVSAGAEKVYQDALQTNLDYTKMQLVLQFPDVVFPPDVLVPPQAKVQTSGRLQSLSTLPPQAP